MLKFSGALGANAFARGILLRAAIFFGLAYIVVFQPFGVIGPRWWFGFVVALPFVAFAFGLSLIDIAVRRLRTVGFPVALAFLLPLFFLSFATPFDFWPLSNMFGLSREYLFSWATLAKALSAVWVQCVIFLYALPDVGPAGQFQGTGFIEKAALAIAIVLILLLLPDILRWIPFLSEVGSGLARFRWAGGSYIRNLTHILIYALPIFLTLIVLRRRQVISVGSISRGRISDAG